MRTEPDFAIEGLFVSRTRESRAHPPPSPPRRRTAAAGVLLLAALLWPLSPAWSQETCRHGGRGGLAFPAGQLADRVGTPGLSVHGTAGCHVHDRVEIGADLGGQIFFGDLTDRLYVQLLGFGKLEVLGSGRGARGQQLNARLAAGWTDGLEPFRTPVEAPVGPDADVDRPNLGSSGFTVVAGLRWETAAGERAVLFIDAEWHRIYLDRILIRDGALAEGGRDGISSLVAAAGVTLPL